MIIINICNDFSDVPGGRYKKEGVNSGEEFREIILEPKYKKALEANTKLKVVLDGGYGYPPSFLEESFGGLARRYDPEEILKTVEFISDEEPGLIHEITVYIKEARR